MGKVRIQEHRVGKEFAAIFQKQTYHFFAVQNQLFYGTVELDLAAIFFHYFGHRFRDFG